MNIETTEQLFMFEVAKMLDTEELIAMSLGQMAEEVENRQLKAIFTRHHAETQQQIKNLEKLFSSYEMSPRRLKCFTADSLVTEYKQALRSAGSPEIKDLVTVLAAEKVEHHEIGVYRGLIALAEELGRPAFVQALKANLHQEQRMAKALDEFSTKLIPV